MSEYIEKNNLIMFLDKFRQPKNPITEGFNFVNIDTLIEAISKRPTVNAIKLDKVKQAREEIKNLSSQWDDSTVEMNEVLSILDKLIESEEKQE
jgi:hypothetical protein